MTYRPCTLVNPALTVWYMELTVDFIYIPECVAPLIRLHSDRTQVPIGQVPPLSIDSATFLLCYLWLDIFLDLKYRGQMYLILTLLLKRD